MQREAQAYDNRGPSRHRGDIGESDSYPVTVVQDKCSSHAVFSKGSEQHSPDKYEHGITSRLTSPTRLPRRRATDDMSWDGNNWMRRLRARCRGGVLNLPSPERTTGGGGGSGGSSRGSAGCGCGRGASGSLLPTYGQRVPTLLHGSTRGIGLTSRLPPFREMYCKNPFFLDQPLKYAADKQSSCVTTVLVRSSGVSSQLESRLRLAPLGFIPASVTDGRAANRAYSETRS
ncbi:hypothetical protein F2P81_015159 [Scophthalmus maximus]|uniref:Uncharacterized protein n=1 Tax=Scophthalmus maximus TaxID=52904 RepID=A0A6A4SJZ0_SCOMX|nr:hypothetical protein F2P81_015159 [Scophthalmus maximus]